MDTENTVKEEDEDIAITDTPTVQPGGGAKVTSVREASVRMWIDKWTKLIPQRVRDDFEKNVRSWRI